MPAPLTWSTASVPLALTFLVCCVASDEHITRIPNNQLSDIRISNLSRVKFSQVKQTLHFKYEDLGKCVCTLNTGRDRNRTPNSERRLLSVRCSPSVRRSPFVFR